jgi:hypothetical protein
LWILCWITSRDSTRGSGRRYKAVIFLESRAYAKR